MTKLQKSLVVMVLAAVAGQTSVQLAVAQIAPMDLSGIQNQAQGVIQQQSVGSQLNSLRLQQNITQDRIRELDLFRPQQPFGATTYYQPQPSGLPPLPQQDALSQQVAAPLPVPPTAPLPVPPPTAKQAGN
jgi:hypothetical protein